MLSTTYNIPQVPVSEIEALFSNNFVAPKKSKKPAKAKRKYKAIVNGQQYCYGGSKEWTTIAGVFRSMSWMLRYRANNVSSAYKNHFIPTQPLNSNAVILQVVSNLLTRDEAEYAMKAVLRDLIERHEIVVWSRPEHDPNGWSPIDPADIEWKRLGFR